MKESLLSLRSAIPFLTTGYNPTQRYFPNAPRALKPTIWNTGGVGDAILSIPIIEELQRFIGEEVTVYSRFPEIWRLFSDIDARDEAKFKTVGADHWLTINTLVLFSFQRTFRGFSNPRFRELYLNYRSFISKDGWSHLIERQPHMENLTGQKAIRLGVHRRDLPAVILGLKTGHPGVRRPRIDVSTTLRGAYITVHDGFDDANSQVFGRSTKNWSMTNWVTLVAMIKAMYPRYEIVQVGGKTSRRIPGIDVDLVGMTSLPECMKVLEGSQLHIDGESGLVHACWLMGTKCVVMFGPTPPKFFGHPENVNIVPNACADEGSCWWLQPDWMSKCVLGNLRPICIDSITTNQVFAEVERILK